ncbi:MAG TPA: glycosyltransferase family 2 protein [Feifaniaceae bacterium]|nr:glycosyltransferase family 2 protein [Feifaniaceae bacterium]
MVSIIVPVYNAQSTIGRCLDSIRKQTLRDIEVIIVNDGSTDNSGNLIRNYTEADPRFRLVEKENAGVSAARNIGIEHASGEFLQFADSDDWLSENASQSLLDAMLLYDADMVISDFVRVYERSRAVMGNLPKSGYMTCAEFATHMMKAPANFYYGAMWNKLYRSKIVKRAKVRCSTELTWAEDFLFNLEYLYHTRRVAVIHEPVYFYVKRKGSLIDAETNLSSIILHSDCP